jgi:hypothetical protein
VLVQKGAAPGQSTCAKSENGIPKNKKNSSKFLFKTSVLMVFSEMSKLNF